MPDDVEGLFEQIEGEPIPGGCDRCDAYQRVAEESTGVYRLTVHHDAWCPVLRSINARSN